MWHFWPLGPVSEASWPLSGTVCIPRTLDAFTDPIAKRLLYVYSSRPKTRSGNPGQTHRIFPAHSHLAFTRWPILFCKAWLGIWRRIEPFPPWGATGRSCSQAGAEPEQVPSGCTPSWLLPEATRVLRNAFVFGCFCSSPRTSLRQALLQLHTRKRPRLLHAGPQLHSDWAWARGRGAHRHVALLHFKKQLQRPHGGTRGTLGLPAGGLRGPRAGLLFRGRGSQGVSKGALSPLGGSPSGICRHCCLTKVHNQEFSGHPRSLCAFKAKLRLPEAVLQRILAQGPFLQAFDCCNIDVTVVVWGNQTAESCSTGARGEQVGAGQKPLVTRGVFLLTLLYPPKTVL
ncbi:hypothetical protein MC885_020893 [Smutsia gigantea]|nr:hypothetical protein MC885_020893 [Smutsia gigantea]